MPNFKGGKKYKSGKHTETKVEIHEINEADGQMIGRVIKNLGDRNMMVYCNDGKERVSHIRGGLRKKTAKIEIGDIVLISLRSMDSGSPLENRGDILAKYERETHGQLKKMKEINPKIFLTVETTGTKVENDDGFEFDYGSGDEKEDDEDDKDDPESAEKKREKRKEAEEKKRAAARSAKHSADDDGGGINIDDI
jgi:translation initiation factor 1A